MLLRFKTTFLILFLQVFIKSILLVGVLSAVALIATTPFYYYLLRCKNDKATTPPLRLFKECDHTNVTGTLVSNIVSDIIGISIRLLLYLLFGWGVVYKRKNYVVNYFHINWWLPIFFFGIIALSATEPGLSYSRDTNHTSINYTKTELGIIQFHAATKFFSYFSMLFISLCSAQIFYSLSVRWKECAPSALEKSQLSLNSKEILYSLYYNYVTVGKEISNECRAVSEWFVVMFCEFFIYLVLNLISIERLVKRGNLEIVDPYYSFAASVMNIIIYGIAFFLSCAMAYRLNSAHQAYYKNLLILTWE